MIQTHRVVAIAAVCALLATAAGAGAPVAAQEAPPDLPATYYGTVEAENADDIVVAAVVNGTVEDTIATDDDGSFGGSGTYAERLEVAASDGATVEFQIRGTVVETVTLSQGETREITIDEVPAPQRETAEQASEIAQAVTEEVAEGVEVPTDVAEAAVVKAPVVNPGEGTATVSFEQDTETTTSVEEVTIQNAGTAVAAKAVAAVELSDEPDDTGNAPGQTVSVTQVEVPPEVEDNEATIRTQVAQAAIPDDVAPSELQVTRYNDAAGEWQDLDTSVVGDADADPITLEATTPGFSVFAVTAETTGDDGGDGDNDDGGADTGGGGGGAAPSDADTALEVLDTTDAIADRVELASGAVPAVAEAAEPTDGEASFLGETDVMAVELQGTTDEVVTVRYEEPPTDLPETAGRTGTLARIVVDGPGADEPGTVQMRVSTAELEAADATPSDIRMVRYNGSAWSALETTVVNESDQSVLVEAQTPQFSYFATVLATEDEAASDDEDTTETPESTEDSGGGMIPGFGISIAVVALLSAALLAKSRR